MPTTETRAGLVVHLSRHILQVTEQLSNRRLDDTSRQKLEEAQTLLLDSTMTIAELIGAPLQTNDE